MKFPSEFLTQQSPCFLWLPDKMLTDFWAIFQKQELFGFRHLWNKRGTWAQSKIG